jgi:hypothetical protein
VEDGGYLRVGTDTDWDGLVLDGRPTIEIANLERATRENDK